MVLNGQVLFKGKARGGLKAERTR